jgi:UMF1 family MFS transporter
LLGCLAFTGAGATFAMFWLDGGRWAFGASMFLLANLAFGAAIVLYNSFLPEIAPAESRDAVSSNGWGFGYLGGGLLLALHLLLFSKADEWGLGGSLAVRVALSTSGIWWATFTVITLATLRNRGARKSPPPGQSLVGAGVRQLAITLREVVKLPQTLLFLAAYLIYNDAIQTVIAMASQFGSEELHLDLGVLSAAILLTQFVAFGGALAFNQLAARIGNKQAVMVALVIWSATLVYAYAGVRTKTEFYAMAAVVGIVLGGSQALSRSIFSFMIPKGHEAEYYSVYEISDKGTSWLGPLFFGLALQWTGSFRVAIVSLIVFFIAGLLLLARVDVVRAAQEAGNKPPPRG